MSEYECSAEVSDLALNTVLSSTRKSNRDSCSLCSCQTKTDLVWLRNHVKVVGEREILAIFVAVQLYSMAEMIRKENEKEKTKVKAPVTTVRISAPPRQLLRR